MFLISSKCKFYFYFISNIPISKKKNHMHTYERKKKIGKKQKERKY